MPTPPVEPDSDELRSQLESVLLAAGGPIRVSVLARIMDTSRSRVAAALGDLQSTLVGGIRVQLHAGEAQLVTAPQNAEFVHRYLGTARPAPLPRSAIETLAVVAYRQPVTRAEVEATRGSNSDRAIQTLLARELIEERGTRPTLGRPMEYGTGFGFLEYFGLSSLDDLPDSAEDLHIPVHQLGMRVVNADDPQREVSVGG